MLGYINYQTYNQTFYNKTTLNQSMGGSESFVDNYVKQHGLEGLTKLVLLKKKISWLEGCCVRQVTRKLDDQIKYILFQIDDLVNQKKTLVTQSYKETKSHLLQIYPYKVERAQKKHQRLLQNFYGRNQILDKLNTIKIEFHIEVHLIKKKVKKSIQQKIANIENSLLYRTTDQPISKNILDNLFQQRKKHFENVLEDPMIKTQLEGFKISTITELNFDYLFWPNFDKIIRSTQQLIENVHDEAESNLKRMKTDIYQD